MKRRFLLSVVVLIILSLCLSACSKEQILSVDDPALLEFPGLKWNSSIEEVKDNLNLKEEQILWDEMNQDEGAEYENWYLVVSDIHFFGLKAERARFIFVRYPGNDYGLMNIQLEFPEGTDANTLKSAMQEVYGEGCDAPIQSYHFNEQGELIADDMNSMVTPAYAAQGFPYYWYSPEKGTEVLSAEAQGRYVAYHTSGNSEHNPGLNRDGLLEYLEKTPLVQVSCMDWSNSDTCRVTFYANHLVHFVQQFGE